MPSNYAALAGERFYPPRLRDSVVRVVSRKGANRGIRVGNPAESVSSVWLNASMDKFAEGDGRICEVEDNRHCRVRGNYEIITKTLKIRPDTRGVAIERRRDGPDSRKDLACCSSQQR